MVSENPSNISRGTNGSVILNSMQLLQYVRHRILHEIPCFCFSKDSFITHCIAKQSKMFSNGFDLTEIGDVFNSNLFVPSVFNENKYALIFNDEAGIIHLLGDKLPLIQLEKIQQLYNKKEVTPISDELLKKAIIDRYPDVNVLYEYEKVFTHYNLTLLGRFIGLTYLNTKIDKNIDWDFE